jgi:DNA-binding YbaB/EbfC family protein
MKNFNSMMKQAQAMQAKMAKMQEELAEMELEATAGGGMVTVRVNGKQEILGIKINPEVVNPEEVDVLEDLIMAALTEAREKAGKAMESAMSKVTGGLGLPPGLF